MAHFLVVPISPSGPGPLDRVLAEPLAIDELAASVLGAYADELVERAQPRRLTVRGRMNKSAMACHDDGAALAAFHDLTEQLWTDGQ
jgi:hypothetical protein